jgi:hypothetical protein
MDRIIQHIAPEDFVADQRIGLKYPFTNTNNDLFDSNFLTSDQIKTDLIMLLLTSKGERFMLPSYGNEIKKVLFSNDESEIISLLDTEIRISVENWLPIVLIKKVDVRRDSVNEHMFYVKIDYTTKLDTNQQETIIISLNPDKVITA